MEDTKVTDAPVVEAPKDEPKEDKKPVLDRNRPLSQQVDKILANMPEEKENAESPEDKPKEKPAPTEEETEVPSDKEENAAVDNPVEEEDEDEEPVAPVNQAELPSWQKYVLENLPDIQVVGHEGTKKDKVYTVKRLEDLPDEFEFTSRRAELAFSAALASQEVNARELVNKYNQEQQTRQYQEFQAQEAVDIQADIQRLQKDGIIEKFKYSEDSPEFNTDPAVKVANAIYDLYKKTNDSYLKEFGNTGRTYRISYRDAADKYFAMQGRQKPVEPPKNDNKQERDKVAEKISGQGSASDGQKKGMPVGSTMQDVLKMYKLGRI